MIVEEEFALLDGGDVQPTEDALMTRAMGRQTRDGEVLIALDFEGRRHVLLPYLMRVREHREGALSYSTRRLGNPPATFLDVCCEDRELYATFSAFTEHLLGSVDPQVDVYVSLKGALGEWKALLTVARGMDVQTAVGLIGELDVLRRIAAVSPVEAWRSWCGPRRQVHDFVSARAALEVKATLAVEQSSVIIHGLDQLDPTDRPLYLIIQYLRADPLAPTLDDRLDDLIALGVPKKELLEIVARMGHRYRSGQDADQHRYGIVRTRHWAVTDDFPGLRRSRLDDASLASVARVSYSLLEAGMPDPAPADTLTRVLTELVV